MRRIVLTALLLLTFAAAAQGQDDHAGDRAALEAFYNALGGDNWVDNTGWKDPDVPMGEWFGITTEVVGGSARVTDVQLQLNNLTGRVPQRIGDLTEVERLWLPDNEIDGVPPEIARLTKMHWFEVSNNNLRDAPAEIAGMTAIRRLGLGGNELGSFPRWLGDMTFVQHLSLANNGVDGPLPAWLASVGDPYSLQVQRNRLSGPVPLEYAARAEAPLPNRSMFMDYDTGLCFGPDFPRDSDFFRVHRDAGMPLCEDPGAGGLDPAPASACAVAQMSGQCFTARRMGDAWNRIKMLSDDVVDAVGRFGNVVSGAAAAEYERIMDGFIRDICGSGGRAVLGDRCGPAGNGFRSAETALDGVALTITSGDPGVIDFVYDGPALREINVNPAGGNATLYLTFADGGEVLGTVRADDIDVPAGTPVPALPIAGLALLAAALGAAGLRRLNGRR